jgi:hypothetical protein
MTSSTDPNIAALLKAAIDALWAVDTPDAEERSALSSHAYLLGQHGRDLDFDLLEAASRALRPAMRSPAGSARRTTAEHAHEALAALRVALGHVGSGG